MIERLRRRLIHMWPGPVILAVLGGYWLLPISGQVMIAPGSTSDSNLWPRIEVSRHPSASDQTINILVTDVVPWSDVLATMDGRSVDFVEWWANPGDTWTWKWSYIPSEANPSYGLQGGILKFYGDCHSGCIERGRTVIGADNRRVETSPAPSAQDRPTKLGVVFANPERNWHGRGGWDVELTYAELAEEPHWGVDGLAERVHHATAQGLRVLVRVDYDRGQSLPPTDDYLALTKYLSYLRRLARDDRLDDIYGYVVGSGFNALDANTLSPGRPVTATWYARLFNGYGEPATRTDNVVQTIRAEDARVRVLVGPIRPWDWDQSGERSSVADVPWLNYMNSLVAAVDEATRAKSAEGIPLAGPDGFAIQSPGRPAAPELAGRDGADEPRLDIRRAEWQGAQAGFRVYEDWLAVINSRVTTQGLPVYVTSTNTFAPDEAIPPAQNYPRGWLTTALQVIDEEPQVLALIWFVDGPLGDDQWDWFSLSRPAGRTIDAAAEFDRLLQWDQ